MQTVIVAHARSPSAAPVRISEKSIRPDELSRQMVVALDKVPSWTRTTSRTSLGYPDSPGGQGGYNIARVIAVELGYDHIPGMTVSRYCSSSLQTTRMALHAIKAGEVDVVISGGVESVALRYLRRAGWPNSHNPLFADAVALHCCRCAAEGATSRHDPGDGLFPDVLHRDGPDRRERRPGTPASARVTRTAGGVRSQNRAEAAIKSGFFARRSVPVTCPTAPWCPPRRTARRDDHLQDQRSSAGVSAGTAPSPPVTPARSPTERRAGDLGNTWPGLGIPRWRASSHRVTGRPQRSWVWDRSRPSRCWVRRACLVSDTDLF